MAKLVSGIHVVANPGAPLGVTGTYLWIALIFAAARDVTARRRAEEALAALKKLAARVTGDKIAPCSCGFASTGR